MTRQEKTKEAWVKERRILEALPGIRGAAKVVLLKIHSLGRCYMRQEVLAAEIGVHRVTVCRALARLEEKGIVAGVRKGQGEASDWWVDWDGVEAFIQPSLFDDPKEHLRAPRKRQTATSRSSSLLHQEVAVCYMPIDREGENDLSLTPTAAPTESVEAEGYRLVTRFYDRKDVPLPEGQRRERDLAALLPRIQKHGLAAVTAALEVMGLDREYLFGSTWQLDKAIKRIKARVKRPVAAVNVTQAVKTIDDSSDGWESLSEGERGQWCDEARRRYPFLSGRGDEDRWVNDSARALWSADATPANCVTVDSS